MPVDIVTRERTAATSLVEEAMLLANECVAEFLADRDLVSAYRVHEDPSPDSLASAAKTLTELGAVEGGLAAGIMLANECVAEFLADRDLVSAYRVHEDPSPDSLASAAKTLTELGAVEGGLAAGIMLGDPRAINAVVEDAAGTAFAPQVNALLLRAQQRAVYKSHNEGHYALGARAYCHFTSPIRRYPDLIAHRVLKVALAKHELGKKEALIRAPRLTGKGLQALEAICPRLCRQASDNERAADAAANASQKVKVAQLYASRIGERDTGTVSWISDLGAFVRLDATERAADAAANASQKVKVAQLYASRIGERDTGTVSWISDLGAFVRLDATGAEGLVRMNALGAEWWDFDDVRLTLKGESTGTRVGLGCRVVVEVASVNVLRGHLDLKLLHVSGSAS